MKALILNSGMGTRMGEETRQHPKCMTRLVGEETILSRQLEQLNRAGVRDVVITTGYCSDILMEYSNRVANGMNLIYVNNEKYDSTNYIYSIYRARQHLEDDVLLMHGDLVFNYSVLVDVLNYEKSCMIIDSTLELPEKDFKAVVLNNRIQKIGVDCFEHAIAAQPLYKILKKDWEVWLREIVSFCEKEAVNCYAENAFNMVSEKCKIEPFDIKGRICGEIDTIEDQMKMMEFLMNEELSSEGKGN